MQIQMKGILLSAWLNEDALEMATDIVAMVTFLLLSLSYIL